MTTRYSGGLRFLNVLTKYSIPAAQYQLLHNLLTEDAELRRLTATVHVMEVDKLIIMGVLSGWTSQGNPEFALTEKGEKLMQEIEALFVKPAKKKVVITIPPEKVMEFNELAPAIKGGSGKYLRCNLREVESAFQWLFKNYPHCTDWDIIMKAGELYWDDQMRENYKYARRVKYLIRKMMQDKSWESDLIEYYDRAKDGDMGDRIENHFAEKIV